MKTLKQTLYKMGANSVPKKPSLKEIQKLLRAQKKLMRKMRKEADFSHPDDEEFNFFGDSNEVPHFFFIFYFWSSFQISNLRKLKRTKMKTPKSPTQT